MPSLPWALWRSEELGPRWWRTRPRRSGARHQRPSGALRKNFAPLRLARWHPVSFFVAPTELLSYGPAHRRDGYPNAPLLLPQLAMALEGGIVVFLELLP